MTCYSTRSTTLLLIVITLATLATAHPHGSEGFDDNMDYGWALGVGGQFVEGIAQAQFSRMTSSTSGSYIGSPRRHQSPFQQSTSQAPIHDFVSPFDLQLAALEAQAAPRSLPGSSNQTNTMPTTGPVPIFVQQRCATPSSMQETPHAQRQPWLSRLGYGSQDAVLQLNGQQSNTLPHYSVSAPTTYSSEYQDLMQLDPLPVATRRHQQRVDSDLERLFPELTHDHGSIQQPISVTEFEPQTSIPITTSPQILDPELADNPNYQPGMGMVSGAVNGMKGWIGRAPTVGDRSAPALTVDTNHLAPPNRSPLHWTPSSASSAGSSARSPSSRRSKSEMVFGEFSCHCCKAAFPTHGDLAHHVRSHQPYQRRNHVCQECNKRFQYRKDLNRHLPMHDPNRPRYYCCFVGCKYHTKGFGRQDHLDRHINTQHNRVDSPHASTN